MNTRQQNCSLTIYPNQLKLKTSTGKVPIYLKLVYKGKKSETRLNPEFDLTLDEANHWDKDLYQIKGKKKSAINDYISGIKARWCEYNFENRYKPKNSLKEIIDILLERIEINIDLSVKSYCDDYLAKNIEPNASISVGTKKNYRKAIRHFKRFLIYSGINEILIHEFKHEHAQSFKIYMGAIAGNSATSTTSIIIKLKTIFNEALLNDIITKNPFRSIKMVYQSENKTPCLTMVQVKSILDSKEIQADGDLRFYRDLFIFGCLTGLSVINIKTLKNNVVFPVFDNRLKLDTSRVKTGEIVIQIISKFAQEIIEKYSHFKNIQDDQIFPYFHESTFNKKLKIIGAYARINIRLTTKISRTTCLQIINNVGYFDSIYKNYYFGWSNNSEIKFQYTTIQDELLLENTNRLDNYFMNNI